MSKAKELEESIEILQSIIKVNNDYLKIQNINQKEIKAIEIVLQELNDYQKGNIVSLKLLEDFYLVNKDKSKQMTLANKELFDNFISKEVVEKHLEKDKVNYIDGIHADNKVEAVQKYISYLEKELLEGK